MIFIFRMVFVLEQFIPSPHVSLCLFTWYRVKFHFLTSHSEVSSFQIWSQLKFLFCMIIISFWYHAKWKIWTLFWNENCKLCSLGRLTHAYHFQGFDERQSRNIFVCCMRCEVWNKTPSAMNIIQPLSPDVVFIHVNEDRRGKLLVLPSCKVPHFYFTIPITAILISCFVLFFRNSMNILMNSQNIMTFLKSVGQSDCHPGVKLCCTLPGVKAASLNSLTVQHLVLYRKIMSVYMYTEFILWFLGLKPLNKM